MQSDIYIGDEIATNSRKFYFSRVEKMLRKVARAMKTSIFATNARVELLGNTFNNILAKGNIRRSFRS